MGYADLQDCVADLRKLGKLKIIDSPINPVLEMSYIQRRVFQAGGPALLFTRPRGCEFPMLANLFGTRERVNYIFRDTLEKVKALFELRADIRSALRSPLKAASLLPSLWHMRPKFISYPPPVLEKECQIGDLPRLVSWPEDGGAFITLPLVYSQDPDPPFTVNLGMYRVQLDGNEYAPNEIGLHYQLQRGIGIHHAHAHNDQLPVNIFIGGPPALTISAIMPLPEGISELVFAGLLGGRRMELAHANPLPVLAQCDFVIQGHIGNKLKSEGPFGDHLGYYSLRHNFPVMKVSSVHHRKDAIWPFTSVGRPPQEDTMFGDLIHECTAPLVQNVFPGIKEIHAVDAAGVHPLLLAIGSERYTPWENGEVPRELLTLAMHLLGTTQTALSKFVLITSSACAPDLSCRDIPQFFQHILECADFRKDLHFFTACACDTLDYSGYGLNEGSRLIWASCGQPRRTLAGTLHDFPKLPSGFFSPSIVMPGILAIGAPPHLGDRLQSDRSIDDLAGKLAHWQQRENFPLVVIVDDPRFCSASLNNFLWLAFTRTDPARDSYGINSCTRAKHWSCDPPLILDARLKSFQAPPLVDDPCIVARVEKMAAPGGPLHGLF